MGAAMKSLEASSCSSRGSPCTPPHEGVSGARCAHIGELGHISKGHSQRCPDVVMPAAFPQAGLVCPNEPELEPHPECRGPCPRQ